MCCITSLHYVIELNKSGGMDMGIHNFLLKYHPYFGDCRTAEG